MPRTVSASEAKNRLGSIIGWVVTNDDEVIVESHGELTVVVISFDEYQKLKEMREQARRHEALARLEKLRERVQARNTDLTDEEADAIADEITRGAIDSLVKKGKVKFLEQ